MAFWMRAALTLGAGILAACGGLAANHAGAGASPAPAVSARSASTAWGAYTFHGCPLYTAGDWFTTNLAAGSSSYVPTAIDPNSGSIIANLAAAYPQGNFAANTVPAQAAVNIVPPAVATPKITGLNYGFDDDPYGDDPARTIPISSPFYQEGLKGCTSTSGDCHVVVLDTARCISWESYTFDTTSWNGSTYKAEAAYVHNLRRPYDVQYAGTNVGPTAAHTPLLGTTDWGEESALPAIPHIVGFRLGLPGVANGGYVAPATGGQTCTSYCAYKLPYGARLRLHAAYPCPSAATSPQAHLLCAQLKTYGMIFDDTVGAANAFGIRLGASSDGTNPWNSADYETFLSAVKITDFDVMQLGPVR